VSGVTEIVGSGTTFNYSWGGIDISDNGRYIVYSGTGVNNSDVFLFDYQTGQTENISSVILPPTPGDIVSNLQPHVALSNNNPILLFTSRVNSNHTIYLYEPGQTTLEEINPTSLPDNVVKFLEDVSVDGNEILYRTDTQLFLFNRTTGNVQTIQPPTSPDAISPFF
jgi:Tol biopolymer transport system component